MRRWWLKVLKNDFNILFQKKVEGYDLLVALIFSVRISLYAFFVSFLLQLCVLYYNKDSYVSVFVSFLYYLFILYYVITLCFILFDWSFIS